MSVLQVEVLIVQVVNSGTMVIDVHVAVAVVVVVAAEKVVLAARIQFHLLVKEEHQGQVRAETHTEARTLEVASLVVVTNAVWILVAAIQGVRRADEAMDSAVAVGGVAVGGLHPMIGHVEDAMMHHAAVIEECLVHVGLDRCNRPLK